MSSKYLEESSTLDGGALEYIHRAAERGLYEIRGLGAKRKLPTFDDLVFLTASLSRYPLEGYREKCVSKTVLGTRYAKKPIELAIPITIAGMSFGALSARAKEAIGRAATMVGTSTTTGDGGMTAEERSRFKDPGLSVPALALRIQPRRSEKSRRDRDRGRAGSQAGRRRRFAGAEDQPASRRDAHVTRGHRSALRVQTS